MFGSISVDRKRVKKPGFTSTICAPAVWSVRCRGVVTRPSIVRRSAGSDGEIEVDHVHPQRLRRGQVRRLAHRRVRPLRVAPVRLREPAQRGGGVVHDLAPQVAADVRAVALDRRRRADVRRRRHREHVRGLGDPDAGRRRARSFRRDVDDHRDLQRQLLLHDLPHRLLEAARACRARSPRRCSRATAAWSSCAVQPVLRDRVHVLREVDREHARGRAPRARARAIATSRNAASSRRFTLPEAYCPQRPRRRSRARAGRARRRAGRGGRASTQPAPGQAVLPTLIPIPSTTRSPASARMPAALRPSTRTSFGCLIVAPRADRVRDRAGGDERQLGPAGDRLRRVERDREHERRVGPGAAEAAAALGLVLGERDGAVRGVRRQHPLGRRAFRPPSGTRGRTSRAAAAARSRARAATSF